MMKLLNVFLFTIIALGQSMALADSYLIYSPGALERRELIERHGATEVFTEREKELLNNSPVLTDILKVELSEKEAKNYRESQVSIEPNHSQFLYSEPMTSLQWSLGNKGDDLLQWTSDIDAISIEGVPGEDIEIKGLLEDLSNEILVAVVDSGVDVQHPDLKEAIFKKDLECKALRDYKNCLATNTDQNECNETYSNFDSDGNGYPMDCEGWNVGQKSIPGSKVEGGSDVSDTQGHGTHVAGIIAARTNNFGVSGVSQSAKILPVKVAVSSSSQGAQAATDSIAKGVLYAIQSKAKIINLSLGWRFDQDSLLMRQMIEYALSKDILIVAAAGNDSHSGPVYPCSYEGVICVASHTVNGELSDFSNFGAHVDIVAPGTKILSAWPMSKRSRSFTEADTHEYLSGTSQAAPHVSGALARLLNAGMAPRRAKVALLKGARKKKNSAKLIRQGNLSVRRALRAKESSFIYPVNKSPALIKWDEFELPSFLLKLENLGVDANDVNIKVELLHNNSAIEVADLYYPKLAQSEAVSERIYFETSYDSDMDFLFKVTVLSKDEDKSYLFQGKAVTLISNETSSASMVSKEVLGGNNLEGLKARPFNNVTNTLGDDLLGLKSVNGKTFLTLLKENGDDYEQLAWARLKQKSPVILNLSKVDINQDSRPEYVVVTIDLQDKKRKTHFFVYDHNFRPSDLKIGPDGVYDNELSVMPGSFQWAMFDGNLVPAWIGVGKRPLNERPNPGPWSQRAPETKINRLYLLTDKGVKTVPFSGEETIPLHLLYQNKDSKSQGELSIVAGDSLGYYKKYSLYTFAEELEEIAAFELFPYIDLLNAKPLPVSSAKSDNAFFHETSLGGARMVAIERSGSDVFVATKRIERPPINEPILRLLSFDGENVIYQTETSIGLGDALLPSQVRPDRIRFDLLRSKSALYLSSSESPGLGSNLIMTRDRSLFRPADRSLLAVGGCSEVGISGNENRENLLFLCEGDEAETAKVIKMPL